MMADRLRLEPRLSCEAGAFTLPSTEFLLGKLDQMDIRLRQLEEKQHIPESYFTADLRRHHKCSRSLSSALHEVPLKGTLMERVQLLETNIRQLSLELDKSHSISAGSAWPRQAPDIDWHQTEMATNSSRVVGQLQGGQQPKPVVGFDPEQALQATDSKEALDAIEKRVSTVSRNGKRRLQRTQLYRRWFPVGC